MSRLTKAPATRNTPDSVIEGSDKGFVVGIDLYGPFTPDVNGHTYAMLGVEVGHTNLVTVVWFGSSQTEKQQGVRRLWPACELN